MINLKGREMGRLRWIIYVDPECNHHCTYEVGRGRSDTDRREKATEVEVKVLWPQTKDAGSHQKLEKTRN